MVILLAGLVLGVAFLVWLWKVPIQKIVTAMQKNGSSQFEAYAMVVLLLLGLAGAIYMIGRVI